MSKTENPFVMKILSTGTGPGGEFISSGCVPDGRQGCDTTPLHNTIMRDPDVEVTDPNPIGDVQSLIRSVDQLKHIKFRDGPPHLRSGYCEGGEESGPLLTEPGLILRPDWNPNHPGGLKK
jgi:hypothetical protein